MTTLPFYSFLTQAPSLMPAGTGNGVHKSTKLGLTCADNLLEPSGKNALYQAQQAAQGITQQILQITTTPLTFLLTVVLSLQWPT
jgi:hypothetical protein